MKSVLLAACFALLIFFVPQSADAQNIAIIQQQIIREGIIDITYPVVSLDNLPAAEKINSVLAGHAARFRASVADNPYTTVMHSTFAVHHNADDILSLTMTDYVYTGGAHGMSYKTGYTFDLASGELYTFNDLIPRSQRDRIDREIHKQIVEKQTPMLTPFNQIKEVPDFYLLPERKLVIFYQLYELAPYAWGFISFPIAY